MVRPPNTDCVRCKGSRLLCGKTSCPILVKHSILKSIKSPLGDLKGIKRKEIYSASPPSFFVGYRGYPDINIGPMLPHSLDTDLEITSLDSPETWLKPGSNQDSWKNLIDIVKFRSSLVRTTHKSNVKDWEDNKILALSQEIAMAEKPVNTEVELDKIHLNVQVNNHAPPSGPIGKIEKLVITENPKVNQKVDYVVSDTDLKASPAIFDYLYKDAHLPTNEIHRVLSAGLLGEKSRRKLVPTRWSITAVDDTISKGLIEKIKFFPQIGEYLLHEGSYLGNNFFILFVPRRWMYEMMECWDPHSIWRLLDKNKTNYYIVKDYELNHGRKTYASNVTGAYYAARLGVAEYLTGIRRQAAVIVIREVNADYLVPLGVWVIRQTVRDALTRKPKTFSSLGEIFKYITPKLKIPMKNWIKTSSLIQEIRTQKTLLDFAPKHI
ncbi:MAG: hypothetical protein ACFFCS_09085 [Candidatus Hodarchaeota archaeon]